MLGGKAPHVAPDPFTSNQHQSLHGAWWLAELWPKVVHTQTPEGAWRRALRLNLARRRWIAPNSLVQDVNFLLLKAQRLAATKTEFIAFRRAA